MTIYSHSTSAPYETNPGSTFGPILRRMKMSKNCRPGLDSRCRDKDGEIRHKNGATRVGTLRQTYGDNFAPGVRSDMKLDTLLDRTGSKSLSNLLKRR